MPTPEKHALLSASSASRWLNCTAAPRFEEQFPEKTSEYAEEGRLAHAICELKAIKKFTPLLTPRMYSTRINKLKKDQLYTDEMDKTSDQYVEHLNEKPPLFGQGVLTDDEIGDLLVRGKELVAWYKDLEEYALNALLNGGTIPGWKAVAGRSNRTFTDTDAAIAAVIAAGYDEALVYERKPKTLTELEKLMGKAEFTAKLGDYVVKPLGKPTLAPMTDKREPYSPAAADFAEVANNG